MFSVWLVLNCCSLFESGVIWYTVAVWRNSEEASHIADGDIQPLATDFQISVSTSLIVLAVYTATLHISVPGGDSGIYLCALFFFVNICHQSVYLSRKVDWDNLDVVVCGSVAEWLGRWTCDQQVVCSTPGLPTIECNPGQVVNTCASVIKQYNLVATNEQWCLAAWKVTVYGVTDISSSPLKA